MLQIEEIKIGKHFMFNSKPFLQEFLQPLLAFGITHLTIIIMRKNKGQEDSIEFMSSDPRIFEPYISEKYYRHLQGGEPDKFIECNVLTKAYTQDNHITGEFSSIQKNQFNIGHGIDLIRKFKDRCEIYYFASTPDNGKIENFYLNNLNLLDSFILNFRENATELLQKSYQNRIYCRSGDDTTVVSSPEWQERYLKHQQLFKPQFTKRELDCAYLVKQGFKTKEIASKLGLSPRTVEKYLIHLRDKTHSKNINQLIINLKNL